MIIRNIGGHNLYVRSGDTGESAVVVVRPGETLMIAENPLRVVPRPSDASDYKDFGKPPLSIADIPRAAL